MEELGGLAWRVLRGIGSGIGVLLDLADLRDGTRKARRAARRRQRRAR